jgi:hypothetical protein
VADVPVFALRHATDFSVHMCKGVQDTQLDRADDKTL